MPKILFKKLRPNGETVTIDPVAIPERVRTFTGLYDGTRWEELSSKEQQDWLAEHSAADWKGRPLFEGDVVALDGDGLVKVDSPEGKAPLDKIIHSCERLSKNGKRENPFPSVGREEKALDDR